MLVQPLDISNMDVAHNNDTLHLQFQGYIES
jgi:hypothetical protein